MSLPSADLPVAGIGRSDHTALGYYTLHLTLYTSYMWRWSWAGKSKENILNCISAARLLRRYFGIASTYPSRGTMFKLQVQTFQPYGANCFYCKLTTGFKIMANAIASMRSLLSLA